MIKQIESFTPYEGENDYIFISYAHANDDAVIPFISMLNEQGYNVWYDDGIEVGSEWQECIAHHLQNASVVICFISNSYVKSDNCRKELHYAISKKKQIINVFLEETALTPGMELQVNSIFALMKYSMSEEDFRKKLLTCPIMSSSSLKEKGNISEDTDIIKCVSEKPSEKVNKTENINKKPKTGEIVKKSLRATAAFAVVGVIIAGLIVGYFTGYFQRFLVDKPVELVTPSADTAAVFKSQELSDIAKDYSGKDSPCVSDLYGLTDINLSGTDIADLSGLEYFTDLYSLDISNTEVTSLDSLPPCTVAELNISDNEIASLRGIENAPKLQILNADNCKITDFGKLNLCQELTEISCLNCRCKDYSCFKPLVKITAVTFSNTDTKSISQVLDMSSLRYVTITDSDLTGRFFKSFDNEDDLYSLELRNCKLDSISGISDFESLHSITLSGCTGITDYSELELLDTRTVVEIN